MRLSQRLAPLAVAICTLIALLALRAADPAILQAQRSAGFDTLQRLWPRVMEGPPAVRVIDIDEKSLGKLGQWPWPRARLAEMNKALASLGAAVVAYDIVFPEPDRLSPRRLAEDPALAPHFAAAAGRLMDTDAEFAASLHDPPAVLAFAAGQRTDASALPLKAGIAMTGQPATDAAPRVTRVTANLDILQNAAAGLGNMNIDLANEQGIVRQMPMLWTDGDRLFPTLSLETLRVAQGAEALVVHGDADIAGVIEAVTVGEIEIPLSDQGMLALHFRPDNPALYVSAADLLDPATRESLRSRIEGHIVLIGTSAVGLLDSRATPLGQTVPGVSVHAQALEQILAGRFLTRPDWLGGAEVWAGLAMGFAAAALATFARPAAAFGFSAIAATAALALTGFAFNRLGLLVDATFPLLLLLGGFLSSVAWRLLVTDRHGRLMRGVFSRYVAPAVLAEIERNPEGLKLGGEVRDVTVMFLDIADFTPLSERLKPDELVSIVNGLWDRCTRCILAEQGTIDKFIGDAIMAFWNAPLSLPAHQARACNAALAIRSAVHDYNHEAGVRARLEAVNAWPLAIRIGMASGPACVGNMGSTDRFDYSIIGETVNTAARAEAACKRISHDIVLAGDLAPETERLALLPAGLVSLKGRSARQRITAVIGAEDMAQSEAFQLLRKDLAILSHATASADARSHMIRELALHHPAAAGFLNGLSGRLTDYRPEDT